MEQIGGMGYFGAFTYEGEEYDVAKELASRKRREDDEARKKISDLDFRPADTEHKGKYEDPFQYHDKSNPKPPTSPNYLFPFHIPTYLPPYPATLTTPSTNPPCATKSTKKPPT